MAYAGRVRTERWARNDGTAAGHHLVRRPRDGASGGLRAVHRARVPRAVRRVRPRARGGADRAGAGHRRRTARCSRRRAPTRSRPRPATRATASGTRRCAPRCSRVRAWSPRCCSRTAAFPSADSASRRSTSCAAAGNRAYDRWLLDFANDAPGRRAALAMLTVHDLDATVAEITWARENGMRGVIIPTVPGDGLPPYYDQCYDQMWAACQDHEMPVHIHGGSGTPELRRLRRGEHAHLRDRDGVLRAPAAVVPDLGRRARAASRA